MRNLIANIVAFAPIILYNIYCFSSNESNSGIHFEQVVYSFVIGAVSFSVGKNIREKGEVK
jgi:hypothetical protein